MNESFLTHSVTVSSMTKIRMDDYVMKHTFIVCLAVMLAFIGTGCSNGSDVTVEDVLEALQDAGIEYKARLETESAYDMKLADAEQYLYQLESGVLTINVYPSSERREEVQRDPFPAAGAELLNGSYGIGRILIFYHNGNDEMAHLLATAFEPLDVYVRHPEM